MKRNILVVAVIITAFILGSCGKYEEGPGLSLRSKKARVTGEWEIEKIIENGKEIPMEAGFKMTMTIDKDGTGKMTYSMGTFSMSSDLEWEFSDDKEKFRMRMKDMEENKWDEWDEAEILKLTNKEFWMKHTETEDGETFVMEMHMKKI